MSCLLEVQPNQIEIKFMQFLIWTSSSSNPLHSSDYSYVALKIFYILDIIDFLDILNILII